MIAPSRSVPLSEITFHSLSYGDPNGRVFWWQDGLYRGLRGSSAVLYQDLFNRGIIQKWIGKRLIVETELTSLKVEGYDLILRHRIVPTVSYCWEWSPEMIRDAGLAILNLATELSAYKLTLQDAHPWNVLFDGCSPVVVDLGSIIPARNEDASPPYDEFCRFFTYPLQLIASGQSRTARALLHDWNGVQSSDIPRNARRRMGLNVRRAGKSVLRRLIPMRFHRDAGSAFSNFRKMYAAATRPKGPLRSMETELCNIHIPQTHTTWSSYHEGFPELTPSEHWNPKQRSVYRIITEERPSSILDIGSNGGWYSQMASAAGIRTVAFDRDEACVDHLYRDVKHSTQLLLPLVIDFSNPSPGLGLCNEQLPPATERLRSDMVLALALTHHLVFKEKLTFEQISKALDIFTKKTLIVEFVPATDRYVSEWITRSHGWYTLPNFQQALRKHFSTITILESYPDPRVLLVCRKSSVQ